MHELNLEFHVLAGIYTLSPSISHTQISVLGNPFMCYCHGSRTSTVYNSWKGCFSVKQKVTLCRAPKYEFFFQAFEVKVHDVLDLLLCLLYICFLWCTNSFAMDMSLGSLLVRDMFTPCYLRWSLCITCCNWH